MRSLLVLCTLLALAGGARAQSTVRPIPRLAWLPELGGLPREPRALASYDELAAVEEGAEREDFTRLELTGLVRPAANFESGGGEVSSQSGAWRGVWGERLNERTIYAMQIEAEAHFYDFSGATFVPGTSDPFNDVYRAALGAVTVVDPEASRSWILGGQLEISGEDEASYRDSLSIGALVARRFVRDQELSMSFGVAAMSRLEDDPWVIPFLGLDWRPTERTQLQLEGTEARLIYQLSEGLDWRCEAAYRLRQFRLNDDGPLPKGVARDEDIGLSTGLRWRPSENVTVDFNVGWTAWREFAAIDRRGNKLSEIETDGAPFVSVGVSLHL